MRPRLTGFILCPNLAILSSINLQVEGWMTRSSPSPFALMPPVFLWFQISAQWSEWRKRLMYVLKISRYLNLTLLIMPRLRFPTELSASLWFFQDVLLLFLLDVTPYYNLAEKREFWANISFCGLLLVSLILSLKYWVCRPCAHLLFYTLMKVDTKTLVSSSSANQPNEYRLFTLIYCKLCLLCARSAAVRVTSA